MATPSYQGVWTNTATYIPLDYVQYNVDNNVYFCTQLTSPGISPSNNTYWQPIVNNANINTVANNIISIGIVADNIGTISPYANAVITVSNNIESVLNASNNAIIALSASSSSSLSANNALGYANSALNSSIQSSLSANSALGYANSALNSSIESSLSANSALNSSVQSSLSANSALNSSIQSSLSANSALGYANSALNSSIESSLSANNALNSSIESSLSANNALGSSIESSLSANNALGYANSALNSSIQSSLSANNALNSSLIAISSANTSSFQANVAIYSANSALNSAISANNSFISFDKRYLGSKTTNPTLDNESESLLVGAIYYNSTSHENRVYNGSNWATAYVPSAITLTSLSTSTATASGNGSLSYDNSTGIFTFTPPSLSSYLTSISSGNVTTALGFTPVANSVTINGHALTSNVTVTASDLGISGTNTGDETLSSIKTKLGITTLSGSNTGDQDLSGYSLTSHNHTGVYEVANSNIQTHISSTNNPHSVTKTQVGLANVTNDSQVKRSELGVALGVATLDASGIILTTQLPSYVDDVVEGYYKVANGLFYTTIGYVTLITGETGKIYVSLDTNKSYRWSGSVFVYITSGAVDSVAGKTGIVTLTSTDVGLENVINTSDVNKPVSTAQQTALDLKANLISPSFTTPILGTPSSGNLTNCTFPTLNQNTTGNAATATTSTNQSGGTVSATTGSFSGVVTHSISTGTAPFSITSTTVNTNLNADLLDGQHGSYFAPIAAPDFTGNHIGIPSGATSARPTGATGYFRFNTDLISFEGYNGTSWGSVGGGATGGGTDHVFVENDIHVTTSYTITSGKNAHSAGPITIDSGAVVTIPTGSVWIIS